MDKGQRDMQLLAVLASNDSARWQRQIARVEKEARDTAARLLTDSSTDDAITQAVSKAVDWLGTKRPFKVEHPAAYLSSVIRNSIRDYARTRKEEAMPDDEISPKLAWIDEGMGYFGQEQEKDSDTGTGGWHGIRVRVKQVAAVREYPEHPYLSLLCSLRGYDGWHTESAEINRFSDQRWAKRVRWTEQLEERALKKIRDRRWAKYKLTMSLINDIPGQREREIIKHYLWGYSVTESARKLYVSKPYVSKVVNRWMKAWGWDKRKRDETRKRPPDGGR